ncbi:MAG: hypothetical protein O8C55_04795 [Candidatus Methanoperedens sp.]|nr:hypothetical protein [Candidatus Methanoperedens sp.]
MEKFIINIELDELIRTHATGVRTSSFSSLLMSILLLFFIVIYERSSWQTLRCLCMAFPPTPDIKIKTQDATPLRL